MLYNQVLIHPRDIEILRRLVLMPSEVSGVLPYIPRLTPGLDAVVGICLTGSGNAVHVRSDETARRSLNQMLQARSELQVIYFHNHTIKTVAGGRHWEDHFSDLDVSTMRDISADSPGQRFLHATPSRLELFCMHHDQPFSLGEMKTPGNGYTTSLISSLRDEYSQIARMHDAVWME